MSMPMREARAARTERDTTKSAAHYLSTRSSCIPNNVPYSITSSARASREGGMVSPSALAVFTLMISLKVVA